MRRAVCYSIGWLVLWACGTAAKDIPISSNYVVKKQESCPDVGYYFRRETSPNAVDPGPCLLCFCTDPGVAACWPRENKLCEVEDFEMNTTDSDLPRRSRRSPLGIGDIFFRDATRDFFAKNMPQECKPNQESFSNGCPPDRCRSMFYGSSTKCFACVSTADWCIGCTVCDCDANGRWDCHVLSFCNEEEREKQIKRGQIPPKFALKLNKNNKRLNSKKPTKPGKKPQPVKKPSKQPKKANDKTKPTKSTNPVKAKPRKKAIKRVVQKVDSKKSKVTGNTKPPQRKIIIKKHANNKTIKQKKENPKQIHSTKLTKKQINNASAQRTNRGNSSSTQQSERDMGQTLVNKVMASVKRMVETEIERLNKTVQEGDCVDVNKKKRRQRPKDFKYRKIGQEFRWMRNKRDIGNESTTTVYDNGIDTTTVDDTDLNTEIDKNTIKTQDEVIPVTSKPLLSNIVLNSYDNFDAKVRPLDKTTENNLLENKNISNYSNVTVLKFQIVVNDDQNATLENLEKNSLLNDQLEDKWSIMNGYKYNIDNELINNTIQILTTEKPNITEKNITKEENDLKSPIEMIKDRSKKHSLFSTIISKSYLNLTEKYYTSKHNISVESKMNISNIRDGFNKTRTSKNKISFLKYIKKILKKLIYFGKRRRTLGPEDEYEIVKMLCDNIKSCKVNKKNRKILKNKIKKINEEAKNIFKTIKTIKGLLHLIDSQHFYNKGENFKNDIKMLNAVLKGDFQDDKNLTTTQHIQIAYLKSNTKTFIMAVSRFITLINEVTAILQRKNKHEVIKTARYAKENMTESFEKIKKILIKHKLVENTFIKKIYSMLTDLELKVSNKTKVSDKRMNNYIINKYSRDIIDNLRKLRDLAQGLNSSRKKRQITGYDDTMDYLLILLEYLLKKDAMGPNINRIEPVVPDGIDVLIDTIKNAPDINDIKKKVIENAPQFPNVIQTINLRASDENETATIESNQISDSNSASKENITLTELKSEELKGEYITELRRFGNDENQSQNTRELLYRDSLQGGRSTPHNPVKDVSGNTNSNQTEEVSDNSYHNLEQEGELYPDLPQDMKENLYNNQQTTRKVTSYEDTKQNLEKNYRGDNTQLLSGDLSVKSGLKDDIKKILKENSVGGKIPNLKDKSSKKRLQNSKITDKDGKFTKKDTPYEEEHTHTLEDTLEVEHTPNKDKKITKFIPVHDGTRKVISSEDATQIVRSTPLTDINQKVYYENVDTTNYEIHENSFVLTETTTPILEKNGFEKYENFVYRQDSDSDVEDMYYATNSTKKVQSKMKNEYIASQTVNDNPTDPPDSNGNLEWIEANFGKELINLQDKFDFTKEPPATAPPATTPPATTVKPATTATSTLKPKETQTLDLSDISDESEDKKDENKLNANEVLYRKQMDFLTSLDYGTEKNDFEETKSDDEATDSGYV